MSNLRMSRVSQEIKREIAQIIINDVHDDRMTSLVSVVDVDVTGDLKHARVLVSVFNSDEKKRKLTIDALNHAASFIRTKLAKKLTFRTVPELEFMLDRNIEYSFEIEKKLKEVNNADK